MVGPIQVDAGELHGAVEDRRMVAQRHRGQSARAGEAHPAGADAAEGVGDPFQVFVAIGSCECVGHGGLLPGLSLYID